MFNGPLSTRTEAEGYSPSLGGRTPREHTATGHRAAQDSWSLSACQPRAAEARQPHEPLSGN